MLAGTDLWKRMSLKYSINILSRPFLSWCKISSPSKDLKKVNYYYKSVSCKKVNYYYKSVSCKKVNYYYKSVSIQISHDFGWATIWSTGWNVFPRRESLEYRHYSINPKNRSWNRMTMGQGHISPLGLVIFHKGWPIYYSIVHLKF